MSYSFSEKLRSEIAYRANWRCEYCLLGESDSFFSFQIDHIIALKHRGSNGLGNLAFACPQCNQYKGSDLATYQESTDSIIPLFHPRKDNWDEHFRIEMGAIYGKTEIGVGTAKLLQFNLAERLILRKLLNQTGRYP